MKERITPAVAQALLAKAGGQRWVTLFKRGALELEYYAPVKTDPQQPHTRDEVYFVARGSGAFVMGEKRVAFAAGDVLFVPARMVHRFEGFTDDLAVWVMFYGPEGGER